MKNKKLTNSIKYAGQGLKTAYANERNFRIHCAAMVITIFIGILFHISLLEWTIVFLAIGLVFATELVNTAIEKMVDMITKEYSEEAKIVKDISAGAVLIAAIAAMFAGAAIFAKPFLRLIGE